MFFNKFKFSLMTIFCITIQLINASTNVAFKTISIPQQNLESPTKAQGSKTEEIKKIGTETLDFLETLQKTIPNTGSKLNMDSKEIKSLKLKIFKLFLNFYGKLQMKDVVDFFKTLQANDLWMHLITVGIYSSIEYLIIISIAKLENLNTEYNLTPEENNLVESYIQEVKNVINSIQIKLGALLKNYGITTVSNQTLTPAQQQTISRICSLLLSNNPLLSKIKNLQKVQDIVVSTCCKYLQPTDLTTLQGLIIHNVSLYIKTNTTTDMLKKQIIPEVSQLLSSSNLLPSSSSANYTNLIAQAQKVLSF